MRKWNIVWAFLFGAILVAVYNHVCQAKRDVPAKTFEYMGFSDYSEDVVDPKDLKEIVLGNYYSQHSRYQKTQKGIVRTASTAAKIGISIFVSKYGEEYVNRQKPFHVYLVNNRVWLVKGYDKEYPHKGLTIYIQKDDATILSISK